ncbi:hypothetical protein [Lysinibacillus xylanilyticus]|uniref:Uncharacterized protein n=1 Tax=Lysinibacillus xylanilyticus TaxID=582475 RepID=A0A2M9Q5W7_9BACI|nr:hypothetical protein [Lysinibacillus xylanilyticus]PJO43372.1 hypothetical protein CWD94_12520 [Lysinibacillus xylanilyticus]
MLYFRHVGNVSREEDVLGRIYLLSNHHRDGNRAKSMWLIDQQEELNIFRKMLNEGWYEEFEGWSLYTVNNGNELVGNSKFDPEIRSRRNLKVAMFEDGNKNSKWHGYPADYLNEQDRPSSKVFDMWVNNGIISKSSKRRFQRGKDDIK